MTFELPEPAHKVGDYVMDCDYWQDLYTADQMQATYAAGRASAVDLMMLGLIQVVAKLQDRVAIAAPEDEPVMYQVTCELAHWKWQTVRDEVEYNEYTVANKWKGRKLYTRPPVQPEPKEPT